MATPPDPEVTVAGRHSDRQQVKPYSPNRLMEAERGVPHCRYCGNRRFRRSRIRLKDVKSLLQLRMPVRCTRCNQRQFASFVVGWISVPAKSHAVRVAEGDETWRAWTEENVGGTAARPATTAAGPQAKNLKPLLPAAPESRTSRTGVRIQPDEHQSIW